MLLFSNTCTDPDLRVSLHSPVNKSLGSRTSSSFIRSTLSLKLRIFVFTSKTETPLVESSTGFVSGEELRKLRLISVMLYIDSFAVLDIWVKRVASLRHAWFCKRENGNKFW